jgi:chromatin-remodeling ATPase INO80
MNLVMQFRKVRLSLIPRDFGLMKVTSSQVCNHPELFERADVKAPFSFSRFGRSGPLAREGDFLVLPYSTKNPIEIAIPEILYKDGGLLDVPHEISYSLKGCLMRLQSVWSTEWIYHSLFESSCKNF